MSTLVLTRRLDRHENNEHKYRIIDRTFLAYTHMIKKRIIIRVFFVVLFDLPVPKIYRH